jgi:predicted ATP-binding protein involved in virulence/cell division protein ZapA (FtsZ GTPase activity inhibitor)
MELVFYYINRSSNGFIKKQGFNFSGNYQFCVDYNKDDETYILKQLRNRYTIPCNFFDPDGCITNITAIVGENGAGKTTLINELSNFYGKVKNINHEPEYDAFYRDRYEHAKFIVIYKENSELICYQNIDKFENETTDILQKNIHFIYQGSEELRDMVSNNKSFENISKVFITNSLFAKGGSISTHQRIKSIDLTPNAIGVLKDKFYKGKVMKDSGCAGGFYEFQDIICRCKTIEDFQQILDICYFQYLKEKHVNSIFNDKIFCDLEINFYSVLHYLEKEYEDIKEADEKNPCIKTYRILVDRYLSEFDYSLQKRNVFVLAYINLLYELIAYRRNIVDINKDTIIRNKEDLENCIKNIIETKLDSGKEYFKNALNEISEYEKILQICPDNQSLLPESDLAFTLYKQVNTYDDEYENLLKLVYKSAFDNGYSFVLRYMNIGGIRLASGERALLNFFSWLHVLPFFHKLDNSIEDSLCDNVQFLIDELDLYCHPLWQQKIIKNLIEEIKNQYSDKKVQIIFTTHSPIVLSDLPQGNVIYLRRKGEQCYVDRKDSHKETFGANIYKLFDDAFFLGEKGQIGEFAKEKIQKIVDDVIERNRKLEKDEYRYDEYDKQLEQNIALIGEDILRNKLYEMLFKSSNRKNESIYERKIALYEKKINELKEKENI